MRETLAQDPGEVAFEPENDELAGMCRRQQAGELAPDLDPAMVLLFLQALVVAPVVLPRARSSASRGSTRTPTSSTRRRGRSSHRIVERLAWTGDRPGRMGAGS